MPTDTIHIDACHPDRGALLRATAILRAGGLVAFPTETVYGLGAHALAPAAVQKIFAAKGRPANNPLIVHVASIDAARALVQSWPESAQLLAEQFWPGPLTLVLAKNERVPDVVTAGGPNVALRIPAHPVALELLETCELPLAAPSANRSTELSPTQGRHVLHSLDGRMDLLLDAGATSGGLESSVIDLTSAPPRLLRPGLVSLADIVEVIGPVVHDANLAVEEGKALPSPGLMSRHYAPRTPLELVADTGRERIIQLCQLGQPIGWVTFRDEDALPGVIQVRLPDDPTGYAAQIYAALHDLDARGLTRIVVSQPPPGPAWLAIHDRLQRAARAI